MAATSLLAELEDTHGSQVVLPPHAAPKMRPWTLSDTERARGKQWVAVLRETLAERRRIDSERAGQS